jgi:microcystin-dependent protein
MENTPKMGLTAWDDLVDPYDYQQFANNWNIVDFHDHTPGRGVQIPYGGIAPGAVGLAQLASDVPIIRYGLLGNRSLVIPLPTPGQMYLATDTGQLFAYTGLVWEDVDAEALAAVVVETARAEAAETAEVTARTAAISAEVIARNAAILVETNRAEGAEAILLADILNLMPSGLMAPFGGGSAPTGWLLCDASSYSASSYPNLYNVIGYTYGGSGGTFYVPDCRGRTLIGAGYGAGLAPRSLGSYYGAEQHTHATSLMGAHSHTVDNHQHPFEGGDGYAQIGLSTQGSSPYDLTITANRCGGTWSGSVAEWWIQGSAQDSGAQPTSGSGGVWLGGDTGFTQPGTDTQGNHTHTAQSDPDDSLQPSLAVSMIIKT